MRRTMFQVTMWKMLATFIVKNPIRLKSFSRKQNFNIFLSCVLLKRFFFIYLHSSHLSSSCFTKLFNLDRYRGIKVKKKFLYTDAISNNQNKKSFERAEELTKSRKILQTKCVRYTQCVHTHTHCSSELKIKVFNLKASSYILFAIESFSSAREGERERKMSNYIPLSKL